MDLDLEKTCQELLKFIDYLQLPESEWPLKKLTREQAKARIANFLNLTPDDPQFLEKAIEEINKILAGKLEVESVPRNLDELVREYEEHKKELAEQREAFLKRTYPTLSEQIRNALQAKYANGLLVQLKESEKQLPEKERILTQNPRRAERVSQQIADILAPSLPQTARIEAFSEKEYREVLEKAQPKIKQILERAGIPQSEKVAQIFINQVAEKDLPLAREVAATPRSYEKEVPPLPRKEIPPEKLVLPKEVADKETAETKGVAYLPVYTTLQPRVAGAYIKRLPYIIPARIIKSVAPEATPEWKELIAGRFVEDYDATIKKYLALGLPENHPIVESLKTRKARLLESQKIRIVRRDGTYYYRDKLAARILKGDYDFEKRTDHYQYAVFGKEKGVYLQPSPAPDWAAKRGYSWRLRQDLNRVGQASRMYERVTISSGRSVIQFTLPSRIVKKITFGRFESFGTIRTTIYRKTVGRAVSYVTRKLAQTTVGKAIKEGFKKAAVWVATKLGVKMAATAVGTAIAPVVGTAIGLVVDFVIDKAKGAITWIWDKVKTIFKEPEGAIAALGLAGAIFIFVQPPLNLVAIIPAVPGAIGIINWIAASAGAVASGFAAKTVAFFTVVATLPITAPIALFTVGIISTIATITFFIVMTTAGAFILPVGPTEVIEEFPPPPAPPDIPAPPGLTFRWPIDAPEFCSSNFGYRPKPNAPTPCCQYHTGIDIVDPSLPNSCGIWAYSTAKGVVTKVDNTGFGGYGKYVIVKHNGLFSLYAHLWAVSVNEGDEVDQTTRIGMIGTTGTSTGCHLHFGFSDCGDLSCFGSVAPDPCAYVSCHSNCNYRGREEACGDLPLCWSL